MKMDAKDNLRRMQEVLNAEWQKILTKSEMISQIMSGKIDKSLFAMYMSETYHYTSHNARNQALVASLGKNLPVPYMKFCFKHAEEETGHELMALNDINSLGFKINLENLPEPLPDTEVLISYLYWISMQGNPIQRLGYSFWAENCYVFINPVINKIKDILDLGSKDITFFIAHSHIDEEHSAEVERMILKYLITDKDWQDFEKVMKTSLRLQGKVIDAVFEEYKRVTYGVDSTHKVFKKDF